MKRIYVPSSGADDWRRLLARPDRQWRVGFSARTLAHCWEEADGFPDEVLLVFQRSGRPALEAMELLLALPEHKVALPGGRRASQNDLFALARGSDGHLVAIMVEGKVAEPFGPSLGEWSVDASPGKEQRLQYIKELLGLEAVPAQVRYQLLHRTASAVIEAQRFGAQTAVMLVHSFSPESVGFADYAAFVGLYGVQAERDSLHCLGQAQGTALYSAWVTGDAKFLQA